MENLRELWIKRKESQGRINITVFFVNIFLLMCHVFLMAVYLYVGHKFMICVNVISLLVYIIFFFMCYKKLKIYIPISFLEIWFHMLCAICSFGWEPSFQNWTFAIVAAYFLPAFNTERKYSKISFLYAFIVIITYLASYIVINVCDLKTMVTLDKTISRMLMTANTLFSFFTIMMFAHFYTSRSDRKARELSLKAEYDSLTNLYNRHALNELSLDVINEAKSKKKAYNVAILDIDYFKKINDEYGHRSGDLVLKKLALILKSSIFSKMVVGRWGGEEFVLFASCDIKYEEFTEMLEKLRLRVESTQFKGEKNETINITISIGAASVKEYTDLDNAIVKADERLYKAKNSGRNRLIK